MLWSIRGGVRVVGLSGVYWWCWQGVLVLRGQKGIGILELLGGVGAIRGHQGVSGIIRGVKGVLGAGRECRHSGARRGVGDIRGHLKIPQCWCVRGPSGGVGAVMDVLEAGRECCTQGPEGI